MLINSAFSDAIIELENKMQQEKNLKKKVMERKNRAEFKALLQEYIEKQTINHKTKWKHFIFTIKDDQRLLKMMGKGVLRHMNCLKMLQIN